jgi:D-alanine-D-alanine ligase
MEPTKVLLLFGGQSSEHEVSIASARNVYAAIDTKKYEVLLGFIDKEGKWWLVDGFDSTGDTFQLVPLLGYKSFVLVPHDKPPIKTDVIFPVLHGEHGEDGTVQGLAELLHIPIVGAGIEASVIAIDKDLCKRVLEKAGVPIVPYVIHVDGQPTPSFDELSKTLTSTLFIKPAHLGSSVGVSKVRSQSELETALSLAHGYDNKVLIEQSVTARELEIGVLGNLPNFRVSGIGEIQPDREFYSYESKYDDSSQTKVIIPAEIPDEIAEKIQTMTKIAYAAIGGRGLARVDFFLDENNTIYLNEINTLPGFTNISMYPKLWQREGIEYSKLIDELIQLALTKGV